MVKVVMGLKGSGKTKNMIELVNSAIETEKGSVVCIERGNKMTYDINYKARLIDISQYNIYSFEMLEGFISGLYASNYDITHVFIDNLMKASGENDMDKAGKFLLWLEKFGEENGINFTVTISAAVEDATEDIRRFI
ncbi:MAG: hypothetical protein GX193_05870 [Clostridiales bacterium]|nr:hypothetical protein [Clostridiales bacterium]